jgi:hypothetical protein
MAGAAALAGAPIALLVALLIEVQIDPGLQPHGLSHEREQIIVQGGDESA